MERPIRTVAALAGVGLFCLLALSPWVHPTPAAAGEPPPDQPRKVVFELFTPPVDSGGGG